MLRRWAAHDSAWPSAPLGRPGQGQIGRDVGGVVLRQEADEIFQHRAHACQLEAEAAPQVEIVLYGLAEGGHHTPPGHGKARDRSPSRSTFV